MSKTIEEGLQAYLSGELDAPLYPVVFPDNVVFPACRYQRITGSPIVTHDGNSGEESARFQVSCFAKTYAEAKGLAGEVKAALSGYSGPMGELSDVTAFVINETDLYEPEMKLHHVAVDVQITANIGE